VSRKDLNQILCCRIAALETLVESLYTTAVIHATFRLSPQLLYDLAPHPGPPIWLLLAGSGRRAGSAALRPWARRECGCKPDRALAAASRAARPFRLRPQHPGRRWHLARLLGEGRERSRSWSIVKRVSSYRPSYGIRSLKCSDQRGLASVESRAAIESPADKNQFSRSECLDPHLA